MCSFIARYIHSEEEQHLNDEDDEAPVPASKKRKSS